MHWRCWTGEIVDLIDLEHDRFDDIMPDEFKLLVGSKVRDVLFGTREEIVEAEHLAAGLKQMVAQMTSQESRAPGHKNSVLNH
jgi:hypothetical protein